MQPSYKWTFIHTISILCEGFVICFSITQFCDALYLVLGDMFSLFQFQLLSLSKMFHW